MSATALKDFKEYELIPSLWNYVGRAFPELGFELKGNRWISKLHIDGSPSHSADQTYIGKTMPHRIADNNGTTLDVFEYVQRRDNCSFMEAMERLASVCGLTIPNTDTEEYRAYKEKQDRWERDLKEFCSALWSDEALPVRELLYSRGWNDEEIRKAKLGYINEQTKKSLNSSDYQAKELGTTHRLVIPVVSGTSIRGFKFRATQETTGSKYLNTFGLNKRGGFFNMSVTNTDAVIVEGELDALHASVKGATNVVATIGGAVSEEQVKDAMRRGVKTFTLLFDNDKAGQDFTAKSIDTINACGAVAFVATLPEGKDTDDYLKQHTIEEWKQQVHKAIASYEWKLYNIIDKYTEIALQSEAEDLVSRVRIQFYDEVEALFNSRHTRAEDRQRLYSTLDLMIQEETLNPQLAHIKDFRAYIEDCYNRKQKKYRADAIRTASKEVSELIEQGKVDEALSVMRLTSQEQTAKDKESEFAELFAPKTPQDYMALLSEVKEGIPTGIMFRTPDWKHATEFTLNAGLTFVCAYRGHGKTSFLNNIALNEAYRNIKLGNGKSVLYFSYEVDKKMLIADLLNTYVNDSEMSRNPFETVLSSFKTGDKMFSRMRRDKVDWKTAYLNFLNKRDEFFKEYLQSGALEIVGESYKVEKLLEAIKYYVKHRSVSVVCIDYAQLIYSEDFSRARTEEIKQVVNQIKDYANKQGIPFVLAAQFNREVESPVSVDTKCIGEGGDFERIADTVIGLFNLKELHHIKGNGGENEMKEAKKLLSKLGVAQYQQGDSLQPIEGKLFCRLLKRRYGYFPIDIVLDWEGRTKKIALNYAESLLPPDEATQNPVQGAIPF